VPHKPRGNVELELRGISNHWVRSGPSVLILDNCRKWRRDISRWLTLEVSMINCEYMKNSSIGIMRPMEAWTEYTAIGYKHDTLGI